MILKNSVSHNSSQFLLVVECLKMWDFKVVSECSLFLFVKNAKFSVCYFYMNTNIKGDFEICIAVPLNKPLTSHGEKASLILVL